MMVCYPSLRLRADISKFNLDIGVQAGTGYYVGECARVFESDKQLNSFANLSEVLGAQLRYKIDQRWSIQIKGQWQRIMYKYMDVEYHNPMWSIDMTAEYNFFRFGMHPYDLRVKPITPFVFIGIGTSLVSEYASRIDESLALSRTRYNLPNVYVPLGIGVKWMFAERWQLQAAWQHQVYVHKGDILEGRDLLNDSHRLNGNNIMNNDLTSSITIGLVFEFWKKGDVCLHCED